MRRWKHVARWWNRDEWAIKLLRLSTSSDTATAPGLVMVQIDGLSRPRFQDACRRRLMPFLSQLMAREQYTLHTMYSGLPSNTPTVQAELFYGVKTAVPAFSFQDHETGRVLRMYDPGSATLVEERLKAGHEPLLEGGSSYMNIFTGGAAEPHFCASGLGWRRMAWAGNPISHLAFLLLYADVLLRIAMLTVVEACLGVIECLRGIVQGKELFLELQFIAARIGAVIWLRELVVLGARLDLARGLPIVHVNFLGYDDHAHRRGPYSVFARWPLVGIDRAIARIWRSAERSRRRDYDVWIYSDHGQEATVPYPQAVKRSLLEAVTAVCQDVLTSTTIIESLGEYEYHAWPRPFRFDGAARAATPVRPNSDVPRAIVAAMGPVAHLYPPLPLEAHGLEEMARRLAESWHVPVVLSAGAPGEVTAWTSEGVFRLPKDAEKILGADHPFFTEATADLIALCHHPSAGALILCGWRAGRPPMSFPVEHGAHAGFGVEETCGFALLPVDAPLAAQPSPYLRPTHLREAAMRALGRSPTPPALPGPRRTASTILRVMTYNIHRCIGLDGKAAPRRIARVIARHRPDVVALQEVDVGLARTASVHQAEWLAQQLHMTPQFAPTISWAHGHYGNAILSRFPLQLMRAERLPLLGNWQAIEPRGALWVELLIGNVPLQLICCHLSIWPYERLLQAKTLMGPDWAARARTRGPIIVCGDFNTWPGSASYRTLARTLRDAQTVLAAHRLQRTWYSRYPIGRLDHVFVSERIEVSAIRVPRTGLDQIASDHLPLVVDLRLLG